MASKIPDINLLDGQLNCSAIRSFSLNQKNNYELKLSRQNTSEQLTYHSIINVIIRRIIIITAIIVSILQHTAAVHKYVTNDIMRNSNSEKDLL